MACGCGPDMTCDDMDNEMLSEGDLARFGDETDFGIACQECGEELYEDAAVCPQCGAFQEEAFRDEQARQAAGTGWPKMGKVVVPVALILLLVFLGMVMN